MLLHANSAAAGASAFDPAPQYLQPLNSQARVLVLGVRGSQFAVTAAGPPCVTYAKSISSMHSQTPCVIITIERGTFDDRMRIPLEGRYMSGSFDPNATVVDGSNTDPNATVVDGASQDPHATVISDSNDNSHSSQNNGKVRYPASPADWVTKFWPDWSIMRSLGGGSFGQVFEVWKTTMGYTTKAAAKIILIPKDIPASFGDIATDDDYFEIANRMFDEIRLMSELSGEHNIVIIQDSSIRKRDDAPGYAIGIRMELLEGLPARQRNLDTPFPVKEAVRVARDVCRALVTCHEHKIMHRDVKPENVFWSEKLGEYKLGDFGVSKQIEFDAKTWGVRTNIGSPLYEAPEVILRKAYSYNVDVYSLGVMLFHLLNHNRPAFLPPNLKEYSNNELWAAEGRRIGGERFPDPACGDDYLADLIRSATMGNPEHRFHNARAFYNALEAWPGWDES